MFLSGNLICLELSDEGAQIWICTTFISGSSTILYSTNIYSSYSTIQYVAQRRRAMHLGIDI